MNDTITPLCQSFTFDTLGGGAFECDHFLSMLPMNYFQNFASLLWSHFFQNQKIDYALLPFLHISLLSCIYYLLVSLQITYNPIRSGFGCMHLRTSSL